ncbi:MAG: FAD-dependent oxidoreductase, partial [Actinomycetota bacterium]|nr:FAD-dependent oxidoreductase [Actinomycetota bacterium]
MTLSTHEAAGQQWDLVVVGAGTAGIVGARTAASLGARVLVVEADRTGGDCLWTGCVPSKALLAAAHRVASARSAGVFGVHVDGVRVDFAGVMGHVRRSIATIEPVDSAEALEAAGVSVLRGWATLTGSSDVEVAGHRLSTRQVLLATGSSPALPDLPGLRAAKPWTSDTVWDLEQLPSRLTVV